MLENKCRTVHVIVIYVLVVHIANTSKNCSKLCTTPGCIQLAAHILSKLNTDIDPCDDIYGFACGRYPEDTAITRHGKNEITLQSAYRVMYDTILQIIETSVDTNKENIAYKRKVIHSSCVNFNDFQKEILLMKKRLSDHYIPNWPNIGSNANADIDEWLLNFQLAGQYSFVDYAINYTSPELYQTYADNRGITLPPHLVHSLEVKVRVDRSTMSDFCPGITKDQMSDFIYGILEGLEISTQSVNKIIEDATYTEHLLLNMSTFSSANYSEISYNNLNCKNTSTVNRWCLMFERLVERTKTEGNFSFTEFKFFQPGMFLAIHDLLNTVSAENISNYLAVRFILKNVAVMSYFSQYFNSPCKTAMNRWSEITFHNKKLSCANFMTSKLPLFVVADYIHATNIPEKLTVLRSVLKHLINATIELIDTTWMPEKMKNAYLDSLKKTTIDQLEYVPYVLSMDANERYMELTPDPESFFHNFESIERMKRINKLRYYKQGYHYRMLIEYDPFIADASSGEDITLGFGFYEIPHSGPSLPTFVNFARLGYTLAHEIVHNIHYVIMYESENDTTSLEDYERCVYDMYSKFSIPVLNVPAQGNRTFAENFADLVGKQIAYEAYLNFIFLNAPELRLPGLSSISGKQLFFILSAQDWCEFGGDYQSYLKNPHSPSEHRIRGPAMNIESYSNIFGCREGSSMNPIKKCHLN